MHLTTFQGKRARFATPLFHSQVDARPSAAAHVEKVDIVMVGGALWALPRGRCRMR